MIDNGRIVHRVFTDGLNPFFQTRREISRSIRLGLPDIFFKKKLSQLYYYGAGCSSEAKKSVIESSLVAHFKTPIQVESNLLAAARGLFKFEPGIACILSTGSNSCLYDGKNIVQNVTPGGYILGDEGGGAVLGKRFIADLLKDLAPKDISASFFDKFYMDTNEIMDLVYNHALPNRFLATISYFLAENMSNEYVYQIVTDNFRDFFKRCISQYEFKNYPIRFIGSIALTFADQLHEVAEEYGTKVDIIKERPMDGLVEYHSLS